MSKHTPGPWKVESSTPDGSRVVAIAPVAWCGANSSFGVDASQSISAKQARANAHLIAAAPELLEALEGLMGPDIFGSQTDREILCDWGTSGMEHINRARAAIAKAKGETQ